MAKPRIRSIKPEFATSGDMLRLSDSTALFFVLLWPICDDEGKHELDYQGIAAKLGGRWHQGKVKLFVSCLIKNGQLRLNSTSTWVQVARWSHQKIDKPRQPEIKSSELQWLDADQASKILDESPPRSDRIGSDRIGSDRSARSAEVLALAPTPVSKTPREKKPNYSFELVEHWKAAFRTRYKEDPHAMPKDFASAKNILKAVPIEHAKILVTAYFEMNDHWYLTKRHDLATLLGNINAVQVYLGTGQTLNRIQIQQQEKHSATLSQLERIEKGLV